MGAKSSASFKKVNSKAMKLLGGIKDALTGGPGKRAGAKAGDLLLNMHKKKR
jgi:hypothetical protein